MTSKNDLFTAAALAVLAACTVTVAHEALGHGTACLTLGGHITILSSSLFRCSAQSPWIDPAGPLMNLTIGTIALIIGRFAKAPALRLFLLLVTTFSYGWEGGYAVQAMIKRDGDLYFAGRAFLGGPEMSWRIPGGGAGALLYLVNIRLASDGLRRLWPQAARARRIARVAGFSAMAAAGLAAMAYTGSGWRDLHDAIWEIAAGALPLLAIPRGEERLGEGVTLARNPALIVTAIVTFGVFTATLGRGLGA